MKREAYFIVDDRLVFGYRSNEEYLLKRTKRGVPSGVCAFDSELIAKAELEMKRAIGAFPLFFPRARRKD